jgi:hypothetical protein
MPAAEARVSLLPTGSAGLRDALPTGTRSLTLAFHSLEAGAEDVMIGAVIDVVGDSALRPGSEEIAVVLRFWADEAPVYATPGTRFALWYGRVVGEGVITRVVDEVVGKGS